MAGSKAKGKKPAAPPPPAPATPPSAAAKKKKKNKAARSTGGGALMLNAEVKQALSALETEVDLLADALVDSPPRSPSTSRSLSPSPDAAPPPATAAAQAELLATAHELYRRLDADPGARLGADAAYWASLPAHIRSFVRAVSPFSPPARGDAGLGKAQAMYAIAQQMVPPVDGAADGGGGGARQSATDGDGGEGAGGGKGGGGGGGGGVPWPAHLQLPLDPSMFSDAAFNLALEHAAAGALAAAAAGQPARSRLAATRVLIIVFAYVLCTDDQTAGASTFTRTRRIRPGTSSLRRPSLC
jgi:hypothetical protein